MEFKVRKFCSCPGGRADKRANDLKNWKARSAKAREETREYPREYYHAHLKDKKKKDKKKIKSLTAGLRPCKKCGKLSVNYFYCPAHVPSDALGWESGAESFWWPCFKGPVGGGQDD